MFDTFLSELSQTFPTHTPLKVYMTKFEVLKKSNPRAVLNKFIEHITPYGEYIQNRDETVFQQEIVPFLKEISFKECWESADANEETKNAIWSHLSSLYFFATTIATIPEGLMTNIEALAREYAGQMEGNETPFMMNPNTVMQNMQTMLETQMKSPGNKKNRMIQ